jgi:hypothetical protein
VDKVLYIIDFGESLMNDAVSMVIILFIYFFNLNFLNLPSLLFNHRFSVTCARSRGNRSGSNLNGGRFTGFAAFIVLVLGGTTIGIVWGFLAGFATKFTRRVLVIEPIVVFIMSYGELINTGAFQLSGIFLYVSFPFLLILHVTGCDRIINTFSIIQVHVLWVHYEELRGGKCVAPITDDHQQGTL